MLRRQGQCEGRTRLRKQLQVFFPFLGTLALKKKEEKKKDRDCRQCVRVQAMTVTVTVTVTITTIRRIRILPFLRNLCKFYAFLTGETGKIHEILFKMGVCEPAN